jgi:hypothetical protein
MALPLYLAQTPLEMVGNPLSGKLAYMSCHFSPGGRGLSNMPEMLSPGAVLILDDSTPMDTHDPELIGKQLSEMVQRYQADAFLLDFQRRDVPEQQELAKLLSNVLPCPVGVSEVYAQGLSCPVFLPPVPPDRPLSEYLRPWQEREIWLEAALDGITLALTEAGCTAEPLWDFPEVGRNDDRLHCHYSVETAADSAIFNLWRTKEDLDALLSEAESLGVAKAIGLWQELGR